MRKSLWIVLALLATLASPSVGYAREIDYLQSFSNGFETLQGNDVSEEVTPERDFEKEYEPVVMSEDEITVRDVPNAEETLLDKIKAFIASIRIPAFGGSLEPERWYRFPVLLFTHSSLIGKFELVTALVFMWWGVRKAKQIIWTAFRTGRLNLGTSVKRAYYKRKAKEWLG